MIMHAGFNIVKANCVFTTEKLRILQIEMAYNKPNHVLCFDDQTLVKNQLMHSASHTAATALVTRVVKDFNVQ